MLTKSIVYHPMLTKSVVYNQMLTKSIDPQCRDAVSTWIGIYSCWLLDSTSKSAGVCGSGLVLVAPEWCGNAIGIKRYSHRRDNHPSLVFTSAPSCPAPAVALTTTRRAFHAWKLHILLHHFVMPVCVHAIAWSSD